MNDEFSTDEGRALWRQAMAAARPAPVARPVAALDLAAWLDGRADAALAARIEAALASDPALLDTALAASAGAVAAACAAAGSRPSRMLNVGLGNDAQPLPASVAAAAPALRRSRRRIFKRLAFMSCP